MSARKDRLRAFLDEIWNQERLDRTADFVAETYTIHNDPGDPWEGRELDRAGFADRVRRSRAAAPDQRFEVIDLIEEGDRIVALWRWTGTHQGEIAGRPATGRALSMTGATRYSFDGDLITGHWQIADRLSIYRQVMAP